LSMASAMSAINRGTNSQATSIGSSPPRERAFATVRNVSSSSATCSRKSFIVSLLYLATTGDLVGVRGAESAVERGLFVVLAYCGQGFPCQHERRKEAKRVIPFTVVEVFV